MGKSGFLPLWWGNSHGWDVFFWENYEKRAKFKVLGQKRRREIAFSDALKTSGKRQIARSLFLVADKFRLAMQINFARSADKFRSQRR